MGRQGLIGLTAYLLGLAACGIVAWGEPGGARQDTPDADAALASAPPGQPLPEFSSQRPAAPERSDSEVRWAVSELRDTARRTNKAKLGTGASAIAAK